MIYNPNLNKQFDPYFTKKFSEEKRMFRDKRKKVMKIWKNKLVF